MRQNLDKKVAEAVKLSGGNRNEATKILIADVLQDFNLLKELTKPFLRGIAGYTIERSQSLSTTGLESESDEALRALEESEDTGEIGAELVRTILSKTGHTFGTISRPARGSQEAKPAKASAEHEKIMRALARNKTKS